MNFISDQEGTPMMIPVLSDKTTNTQAISHHQQNLKAAFPDVHQARVICRRLEIPLQGVEHQVETYFQTRMGELKLREVNPGQPDESCLLILSKGASLACGRSFSSTALPLGQSLQSKALLEDLLGVHQVVDQTRETYPWENLRIHLDQVKGLGSFIQMDWTPGEGPEAQEVDQAKLSHLMWEFQIQDSDCITESYADLLQRRGSAAAISHAHKRQVQNPMGGEAEFALQSGVSLESLSTRGSFPLT